MPFLQKFSKCKGGASPPFKTPPSSSASPIISVLARVSETNFWAILNLNFRMLTYAVISRRFFVYCSHGIVYCQINILLSQSFFNSVHFNISLSLSLFLSFYLSLAIAGHSFIKIWMKNRLTVFAHVWTFAVAMALFTKHSNNLFSLSSPFSIIKNTEK